MKVLTLVWIERLHELIPEPAAKLVALLSKGYGGFLMVHNSRLTHRECGTCGTSTVARTRYIERGATEPTMAVRSSERHFGRAMELLSSRWYAMTSNG